MAQLTLGLVLGDFGSQVSLSSRSPFSSPLMVACCASRNVGSFHETSWVPTSCGVYSPIVSMSNLGRFQLNGVGISSYFALDEGFIPSPIASVTFSSMSLTSKAKHIYEGFLSTSSGMLKNFQVDVVVVFL